MSGFQSNPQAHFPVPDNPLQQRAYYEVNPVPYDTTVERAHARQDRIRADGPYFMIPPTRDQERQNYVPEYDDGVYVEPEPEDPPYWTYQKGYSATYDT